MKKIAYLLLIAFFIGLPVQAGNICCCLGRQQQISNNDNDNKLIKNDNPIEIPTEFKKGFCLDKVVNKNAFRLIGGLKRYVQKIELNGELCIDHNIFQEILFTILLDTSTDERVRANIALEFLADKTYSFLHTPLLQLIEAKLKPCAHLLEIELNAQGLLLPTSAKILDALITYFSENPSLLDKNAGYDDTIKSYQIMDRFQEVGLLNSFEGLFNLMNDNDIQSLVKYLFNTHPVGFDNKKIGTLLKIQRQIIKECGKRKINLNFENKKGITPLIWTTTLPLMWLNNGHTQQLLDALICNGADIHYKNKDNKTFKDFALSDVIGYVKNQSLQIKKFNL